jgi:hypothetical protein
MSLMTVYHGGYVPVEKPEIRTGRFSIVFCTPQALQCLRFRGSEVVHD